MPMSKAYVELPSKLPREVLREFRQVVINGSKPTIGQVARKQCKETSTPRGKLVQRVALADNSGDAPRSAHCAPDTPSASLNCN